MTISDYLKETQKTIKYVKNSNKLEQLMYLGLAASGEMGEVNNEIKKLYRDDLSLHNTREKIVYEIGDVFWYLVRLCEELGYHPEDVLSMNIKKLEERNKEWNPQN